jgi:hypothetical protein
MIELVIDLNHEGDLDEKLATTTKNLHKKEWKIIESYHRICHHVKHQCEHIHDLQFLELIEIT